MNTSAAIVDACQLGGVVLGEARRRLVRGAAVVTDQQRTD
jgi:hypothetical protein